MSCVLRISGKNFDVDDFIAMTKLKPCQIFKKGEPKFKTLPNGKKLTYSGVNIVVSRADFKDFKEQTKDATEFLHKHRNELNKFIKSKNQYEAFVLDFGINSENDLIQCYQFPSDLLKLAAGLNISIWLSQYLMKK